jgi:hypothetical protein
LSDAGASVRRVAAMHGRRRMLVAVLWRPLLRHTVVYGVALAGRGQGYSVVRFGVAGVSSAVPPANAHRRRGGIAVPPVRFVA